MAVIIALFQTSELKEITTPICWFLTSSISLLTQNSAARSISPPKTFYKSRYRDNNIARICKRLNASTAACILVINLPLLRPLPCWKCSFCAGTMLVQPFTNEASIIMTSGSGLIENILRISSHISSFAH